MIHCAIIKAWIAKKGIISFLLEKLSLTKKYSIAGNLAILFLKPFIKKLSYFKNKTMKNRKRLFLLFGRLSEKVIRKP